MSPKGMNDDGFDEFAMGAWRRLHWTAYMLTGDTHLAEDLAQTALARAYERWPKVRRAEAFAYTRKVLVNANVDRLRRRHITEVLGVEMESMTPALHGLGSPDNVEQRDQLVRLLLATLTECERKVVVLRYYYDLAEDVVAEELSVSVGTVKSTASKALSKLRHENADAKGVL
jgi:RNA polymerase sigma-70 factor (sigma-E family)